MKKHLKIIAAVSAFLLIVLITFGIYLISCLSTEVGVFNLDEYIVYVDNFSYDCTFGEVNSCKQAKNVAEEVWFSFWGKDAANSKPYSVYYDETNSAWLVRGNSDLLAYYFDIYIQLGGDPYIIIDQETGAIMAVWHTR